MARKQFLSFLLIFSLLFWAFRDIRPAMLVLAMIPIVVFYLFCQKYIIKGVVAGAVKG